MIKSVKTICAFMDCNIENSSCGKDYLEAFPLINLISYGMKLFISSLYFMWSAEFDLYNTDQRL